MQKKYYDKYLNIEQKFYQVWKPLFVQIQSYLKLWGYPLYPLPSSDKDCLRFVTYPYSSTIAAANGYLTQIVGIIGQGFKKGASLS